MAKQSRYSGSCHCGAVRLFLPRQPDIVIDCNCSWCAKTGVWWGYFLPSEVCVEGVTQTYVNAHRKTPYIQLHFCEVCGCSTHWTSLPIWNQDKIGVNMRLFDAGAVSGVELRFSDGKNWNRRDPPGMRQASIILP